MTKQYELTTIKDIFEKVPADRITDCMGELAVMLTQSAALRDMIMAAANSQGIEITADCAVVELPDTFVWVDDGKGELQINLCSSDGEDRTELGSIKTKLEYDQ